MNNYEMMKISDRFDDDGIDESDLNLDCTAGESETSKYKNKYKDFYDDIKNSHKEDW